MSYDFLSEIGIKDCPELKEVDIFSPAPFCLEITTPRLLSATTIGNLLYALYHHLNYLFPYLDYHIKINQTALKIEKNTIREYIDLIYSTPFLWRNKHDLIFFCEREELWKNFDYQNNFIRLFFSEQENLTVWREKIVVLKELLGKLGLTNIRFSLQRKKNQNKEILPLIPLNKKKSPSSPRISCSFLLSKWKERKLFELGIHTKYSTIDGISSPADYLKNAKEKNYAALAITDHYNVQIFPEFSAAAQKTDLLAIYGCELEMLEDDLPPYLFNHHGKQNENFLTKKITELTYCVFDLETTGFFSSYNEIIEIGYVIYQEGKIIREGEYLVCPEKEIAPEVLASWYTSIDPQELKKAPKIKELLPQLREDWQDCILVAHNARNFDYGFLNKVWKEHLGEELPHPVLDTLPLSWILLPERKSYSLEKLSHVPGRAKVLQTHRALEDSKLLVELLKKWIEILKVKKIDYWGEIKELITNGYFPNRGYRVKVLVNNQEGLHNLYRLITLAHTKQLFKKPCIFRSDLVKYRSGLLVGAAGGREGEVFNLFSSFNSEEKRRKTMRFYDYLEINSPETFRYLWLNGKISETELKKMLELIIRTAEKLSIPVIASHNVHYCQKKEKILKEVIVANEGMGGSRHYLYSEATFEEKEDRFANLPSQHLLSLEEMLNNWLFLNNQNLIEKIIFNYPQLLVNKVKQVNIHQPPLNYSITRSIKKDENDLISAYTQRAKTIFGEQRPDFVQKRIEREWQVIKSRYIFIYWLAFKVVQKTQQDGFLVGSRGSIGSSFIAYLCGITDLNPLPFYKFCSSCRYVERYETLNKTYSCYDYREKEQCPRCSSLLTMEGHNLPFETFFGWEGEKTPDIDLNFSGEYQKIAHNYVRELLGENSVYRIGTINTLSQQTAEIFWKEHLKLRQKINQNFSEEKWYEEWINHEKIYELQKQLRQLQREKAQLEKQPKKLIT